MRFGDRERMLALRAEAALAYCPAETGRTDLVVTNGGNMQGCIPHDNKWHGSLVSGTADGSWSQIAGQSACKFNGTSQFVRVGAAGETAKGIGHILGRPSALTIVVAVGFDSSVGGTKSLVWDCASYGSGESVAFYVNASGIQLLVRTSAGATAFSTSQYIGVGLTVFAFQWEEGGWSSLSANGSVLKSTQCVGGILNTGASLALMRSGDYNGNYYPGPMTHALFYRRALSKRELEDIVDYCHGRVPTARRRRAPAGAAPPSFKAAWLAGSRQTKIIGGGLR